MGRVNTPIRPPTHPVSPHTPTRPHTLHDSSFQYSLSLQPSSSPLEDRHRHAPSPIGLWWGGETKCFAREGRLQRWGKATTRNLCVCVCLYPTSLNAWQPLPPLLCVCGCSVGPRRGEGQCRGIGREGVGVWVLLYVCYIPVSVAVRFSVLKEESTSVLI